MNAFDYYQNPKILAAMRIHTVRIKNHQDLEDFRQEVYAELYDFMPIDTDDAIKIVDRVGIKFRRGIARVSRHETGLTEAGIL